MKSQLFAVALATTILAAAPAAAQTYTGGSGQVTGIGSDPSAFPGTPFDTATFKGVGGTYTGYGTYDIDTVDFLAGPNRHDDAPFSNFITLNGTFDGNPFTYNVDYSGTISAFDTITFGGNSFDIGNTRIFFNPLTLTSAGDTSTGTLSVTTSAVPEPATWLMMIAGFGMIGAGVRRRRQNVTTRVAYA
jgi:hypothetical protein